MLDRVRAASFWTFQHDNLICLNHGSFGGVPLPVQQAEDAVRNQLRRNPFEHLVNTHGGMWFEPGQGLMEQNRRYLATVVGATADNLVLTTGATDGVQAVLRSLRERGHFKPDDEILLTSWSYSACTSIADETAKLTGAKLVVVQLPFPISGPEEVRALIKAAITPRTKLVMVDHIASIQAAILPVADIVIDAHAAGVPVLIDGAHSLAQVPLSIDALGADFYVGTCHKHFCAPIGTGYLSVAPKWQDLITPNVISYGYDDDTLGLSRFVKLFNWQGTRDYSPLFALQAAHEFLEGLMPTGMMGVMADNHALVLQARDMLLNVLKQPAPLPDSMTGTMAPMLLPPCDVMAVRKKLWTEHKMVTQFKPDMGNGQPGLRITAHAYNSLAQYEKLAKVLPQALAA